MKKPSVGKQIVRGLQRLVAQLRSGKPVRAVEVRKVKTPDGTKVVRRIKQL